MSNKTPVRSRSGSTRRGIVTSASKRSYSRALREAGVKQDDLRLLRELADMNANELGAGDSSVHSTRVFL
jgi:hypothetical protein